MKEIMGGLGVKGGDEGDGTGRPSREDDMKRARRFEVEANGAYDDLQH